MKARLTLTVITLILYAALFNVYIFEITRIDINTSKLFYNYLTAGAVLFYLLDSKFGYVNGYHKQFNLLLILCILVNYVIIILVHSGVLSFDRPKAMFYAFNITIFAITLTIFICEMKYKTFKD